LCGGRTWRSRSWGCCGRATMGQLHFLEGEILNSIEVGKILCGLLNWIESWQSKDGDTLKLPVLIPAVQSVFSVFLFVKKPVLIPAFWCMETVLNRDWCW
jgi:hypothetical protein